ncbi:GIY-YIG nuclease family protein [Sphingopyxis panaciterrae]
MSKDRPSFYTAGDELLVYMLHCRGRAYYVGHTDDLERRVGQHQSGAIAGFTADKLPVELVWSERFPTRIEALEAERRIKGWSRAKKMALIRGDRDKISALGKGKEGPSTSSGQTEKEMPADPLTVRPELAEGLFLVCHPDTPSNAVLSVTASVARNERQQLVLLFKIMGEIENISIPVPARYASRSDGLWQTTCVEAFARPANAPEYLELNIAPSTAWAAYLFRSYRERVDNPKIDAPPIDVDRSECTISISAAFDMASIEILSPDDSWHLALSAVIEETDGTKSYWALAHPPGKPDFHHPDCFALALGAPDPA